MADSSVSLSAPRVASIDAFRGLVIFSMVFVNHIAGMADIPGWMKHVPNDEFGMTFVDVVFPAFLFIVGMVIPVAVERRLQMTQSYLRTVGHVLTRFAGLVIVGVLWVNVSSLSAEQAGIGRFLWGLLMFVCVVLAWNLYPKDWKPGHALRGLGIVGLIVLAAVYRREDGSWLRTEWWGILGLIGWAYLAACLVYMGVRRSTMALVTVLALFIAYYEAGQAGALSPALDGIHRWLHTPTQIATHGAIVLAGVIAGVWATSSIPHREKLRNFILFGLALLAAGYLLRPLHDFHKNMATESWALASAGWSLLVYALFFFLMDMVGTKRWAIVFQPAGQNPLLAYILPSMMAFGTIAFFDFRLYAHFNVGLVGIIHGLVFAAAIMAVTAGANRLGVVLKF